MMMIFLSGHLVEICEFGQFVHIALSQLLGTALDWLS